MFPDKLQSTNNDIIVISNVKDNSIASQQQSSTKAKTKKTRSRSTTKARSEIINELFTCDGSSNSKIENFTESVIATKSKSRASKSATDITSTINGENHDDFNIIGNTLSTKTPRSDRKTKKTSVLVFNDIACST